MRCLLINDLTVPSAAGLTLQDCSETFMGCRCDVRRCALTVKMAEAAEAPQHRFFCHCCKCETNPKLPVSHFWRVVFFCFVLFFIPHAALWIIQAHMEREREGGIRILFGKLFIRFWKCKPNGSIRNSRLLNNTHWDRLECDTLFALVDVCVRKACA